MHTLRTLILLAAVCAPLALAQTPPAPPPPGPAAAGSANGAPDADPRIATLEAARSRYIDADGKPTDQDVLDRINDAIARLRALPQLRERASASGAEADGAPAQIASFQSELDSPGPAPESLLPPPDADLAALEAAQSAIDERLQAVRARLDSIGRQRVEQAARADAIPAELAAATSHLDQANDRLAALGSPDAGAPATDAASVQRLLAEADRDHARATIDKLDAERRLLKAVAPRRDLRARLAEREAVMLNRARELLAARVAEARQGDAARQQARTQRAAADVPPELEPLRRAALAFSDEQTQLVARLNAVEAELAATRTLAQQVAERDAQIRARVAGAEGGAQVGVLLQRAKETLPDVARLRVEAERLNREAASLDDRVFELRTRVEDLPGPGAALRAYLRSDLDIPQPTDEQVDAAQVLIDLQRRAAADLEQTIAGPGRLIAQAQELAAAKADLAMRVESLDAFIDARILWIRSDASISRVSLRSATHGLDALFQRTQWDQLRAVAQSRGALLITAAIAAPLGLALLILVRIAAARRLRALRERLQTPSTDRLWLTLAAAALVAVRTGAIPLLLVCAAAFFRALTPPDRPLPLWLASGLARCALPIFVGSYLIALCRPGGVGQTHFHWPQAAMAAVSRHLRWFTPTIAGVAFIVAGARASGGSDAIALLRLLAPLGLLASAAFFALLLRPAAPLMRSVLGEALWGGWRLLWPLLYIAVIGVFLALAVLHLLGWTFSVRVLTGRLFDTAVVVAVLVLIRAILLRGLALARRRLAFEQHRKTLEAMAKERESAAASTGSVEKDSVVAPPDAPPELDLGSIHRQTRQLLSLGLWVVGAIAVLPIWREVFPAVERIDDIRLLPFAAGADATNAQLRDAGVYVLSLADVLAATVIGFVGAAAVRNVPPLFDGFVLSRTRLDIGARYAVTTLTRYLLIAVVLLMFLSSLGFSGKSLGWAIAGLSVGLGLGLQEYVGNFVAGLSLLFERAIRPGDWVTVGGVEGIVRSLSIRATVLTDFDRRDVIIPNRTLISEIVVNFTRSDNAGRAIIKVGVAYSSDTRLVERLLTDTVKNHPLVDDALVTFDTFGDNALNFTIRTYIKEISQRLTVINELHHRIAAVFRRHNIEISFPQRDLHVRDGALEVRLVRAEPAASRDSDA